MIKPPVTKLTQVDHDRIADASLLILHIDPDPQRSHGVLVTQEGKPLDLRVGEDPTGAPGLWLSAGPAMASDAGDDPPAVLISKGAHDLVATGTAADVGKLLRVHDRCGRSVVDRTKW